MKRRNILRTMNPIFLVILAVFLLYIITACSSLSGNVIETVIIEITSTPIPSDIPEPTPTEIPELDMDSFMSYTQTIFDDMYGSCVGLSRKDWGTTDFTLNLLYRVDAEKCINLINNHDPPLNCEFNDECNQLSSLALEYKVLITDGWRLLRKGEDTHNDELVSDGLGLFWDADEMWLEIRDAVFAIEEKYGWEIH